MEKSVHRAQTPICTNCMSFGAARRAESMKTKLARGFNYEPKYRSLKFEKLQGDRAHFWVGKILQYGLLSNKIGRAHV